MEEKHTPGPWIWDDDYQGLYGAGPDNAVLNYYHCEGMHLTHASTRDANGKLIAAAPDLLEALQGVLKIERGTSGRIIIEGWQEEVIRAAIAKATGK